MITKFTKAAPLQYPTSYRECAEFIRHVVATRRPIAMTNWQQPRTRRDDNRCRLYAIVAIVAQKCLSLCNSCSNINTSKQHTLKTETIT